LGGFDEDKEDDLEKLARADRLKERKRQQEVQNAEECAVTKTYQPTITPSMSLPTTHAS
jgi:hypothetical protein